MRAKLSTVTPPRLFAVLCIVAALTAASASSASDDGALARPGIVFSVFESLPPDGACPGLYSVDAETREISWLGGFDASAQDFAAWPAFTAAGRFSYGYVDRASAQIPILNVYAGNRLVTPAVAYPRRPWAPRREELAFGRLDGRGRLELAIASAAGTTRRAGPPTALWPTWTPDGTGVVYARGARPTSVLTFVSRDGRVARNLASGVREYPAPQVSPNGKRVAFVRSSRT